jgi:hypothetical protein
MFDRCVQQLVKTSSSFFFLSISFHFLFKKFRYKIKERIVWLFINVVYVTG